MRLRICSLRLFCARSPPSSISETERNTKLRWRAVTIAERRVTIQTHERLSLHELSELSFAAREVTRLVNSVNKADERSEVS